MKKIAALGAVVGLAMLGGCVGPYDSYDTGYSGSYAYGPYDTGPTRYDTYYGPDYFSDRPYYGGGYRAYNPGQGRGNEGRGDRGDNRRGDTNRGAPDGRGRDGMRPDGGRRNDQAVQRPPQQQNYGGNSAPARAYVPPSMGAGSGRAQALAPPPAPAPVYSPPSNPQPAPSSGWNGFQGRNPNDPNNTD